MGAKPNQLEGWTNKTHEGGKNLQARGAGLRQESHFVTSEPCGKSD